MRRAHAALTLFALVAIAACGGGVRTVDRGPAGAPVDPVLVQVVKGAPLGDVRYVSLSSWEVHPADTLPAELPASQVAEMRRAAAARGATRLYLERVDDAFRRAFFGVGVVPTAAGQGDPGPCGHPAFAAARAAAEADGWRCLERLRATRPALRGQVAVIFQIDAEGRVMRAAATPASTRDGMAQRCVLRAAHEADWGTPAGLSCTGQLSVTFGGAQ